MLTEIDIKQGYSTSVNDIGEEFYVPTLQNAISYKRIAGYFSSTSFLYFAKGIEGLLKNNGKYFLIVSEQISKEDYESIKVGYKNKMESLLSKFDSDNAKLHEYDKESLANLAYLIEIGLVDIKIGFTYNKRGIFHAKYGIITDAKGNSVYFGGSFNETGSAFVANYENIDVKKNWIDNETKLYIYERETEFDLLWNNQNTDGFVFIEEANKLLKKEFIKYSKGRLIVENELELSDTLILYYENSKFQIKNNLLSEINENSRPISKIKKKFLENNNLWYFKDNIDYKQAEKLIEYFNRYAKREKIKFYISKSVNAFIESSKFEIDEVARIGKLIKSQDSTLLPEIHDFEQVVNQEISRPLREIQSWVSYYMSKMKRVANFSVPGAGKTAMVYGTFAYLSSAKYDKINKMLVIGPKNSFLSWKDEFSAVFGEKRDLKVLDIHAFDFRKELFYRNVEQYNLILINYESLQSYQKELEQIIDNRTMIVFDEVHKIKSTKSNKSEIATKLSEKTKYRYVLTGTPIPNSYSDIWNFLHILYDSEYKSYFGLSLQELNNPSQSIIEQINTKIRPFFWRVTKKELGVPKVNVDNLYSYIATKEEQDVIDLLWRKYSHEPFKLYIRLIQLSSNPSLLINNVSQDMFVDLDDADLSNKPNLDFEFEYEMMDTPIYDEEEEKLISKITTSTKYEACLKKCDELAAQSKPVIIWCIFVMTIEKLAKDLQNSGQKVAVITGIVPAEEREKIIKEFQNGMYDVLVTNPHTLAESVSLHMICHDAIYLEYSFNLTHMLQSRDRIHRLGLPENTVTNYYYFMLEGVENHRSTIDLKIYNRLKEKEQRMLAAIEGDNLAVEFSSDEKTEILELMMEI